MPLKEAVKKPYRYLQYNGLIETAFQVLIEA
jgi:hypothetical protein